MNSTIYIRKENEVRWDNITDKSAWVNAMLEKSPPNSIVEREGLEPGKKSTEANRFYGPQDLSDEFMQNNPPKKIASRPSVTISSSDVPQTIDNPMQLKQVLKEDLKDYRTCKHGADPAFCKQAKPGKECK